MFTPGGELEFVLGMFEESCQLKDKVIWFTSLLGKKSDYMELQKFLQQKQESMFPKLKIRGESFKSGKTVRWIICWSFMQDTKDIS
jgi:23S rRNA A1618 N6-methylase RlmF